MRLTENIKHLVCTGSSPLIAFNDINKELLLYGDFREYVDVDVHVDIIKHVASYNIGDNLIDFISIPDANLKDIRDMVLNKTNCFSPEASDNYGSLYIYLVLNLYNSSSLSNEYRSKLEYISEELRFAIDYCCSTDNYPDFKELTNLQRYYLYCRQYPDNINTNSWSEPSTRLIIEPHNELEHLNELPIYRKLSDNPDDPNWHAPTTNTGNIPDNIISWVKHTPISKRLYYECLAIEEYLIIEFRKMIELDLKVKKCKKCGKYFVLKGDYSTDYCDRISAGEKFTCKRIAAINARKSKISSNPILKEYEKAYKRKYAQVSNKRLKPEEFRLWVDEATSRRKTALEQYSNAQNEQIVIEFKKYLNNK